jgi:hypothetical protein
MGRVNRGRSLPPVQFVADSPLEGTGFEPSVPRDTAKPRPVHLTLARFPETEKVGANENRQHKDARRLLQD